MDITRIDAGPRMSAAVIHGNTVYTAGLVAADTTHDVEGQTRQILARADELFAQAGTDKSRLIRANIWLADIADFAVMNSVWDAWVVAGQTPARATVQAPLATPAYRVEIMFEAAC